MKIRNVLLFVLCMCLISCARYHTRLFEMENVSIYKKGFWQDVYGKACGPYLIHPSIVAYKNSSRIDTDKLYPFIVSVYISDTSSSDYEFVINQIHETLRIESLALTFHPSNLEIRMVPLDTSTLLGPGNKIPGVHYLFDTLTIPAEIDSITVAVPIGKKELDRDNIVGCDTLIFHMHRKESSSIGPLLN